MWFLCAHNSSASCCSQYSGKTGVMAAVWHQASREHMAWMAWHSTRNRMWYCRLPSGTVTTRSSPPDTNPKLHQIKLYLWAECLGETCLLRCSLANRLVYGEKWELSPSTFPFHKQQIIKVFVVSTFKLFIHFISFLKGYVCTQAGFLFFSTLLGGWKMTVRSKSSSCWRSFN